MGIPAVQTSLGKYATEKLNEDFGTNITINRVGLQLNGDIELKEILIKDHHNDTLISIGELNSSVISFNKLMNNKFNFGDIDIQELYFNLKTYKNEIDTNLDVFVEKFDDDQPRVGPSSFLFSSSDVTIEDGIFKLTDENIEHPEVFSFYNLNANTTNFIIKGPDVSCRINYLSLKDHRDFSIKKLSSNFKYTLTGMYFDDLSIKTPLSHLKGKLNFTYAREDLKYFTDKVKIDAQFEDSIVELSEVNSFYNEFGDNYKLSLDTKLFGTLNKLYANKLKINSNKSLGYYGNVYFENLFSSKNGPFKITADYNSLSTTYNDLVNLMPKTLNNAIPLFFSKLGYINVSGKTEISNSYIDANILVNSDIGNFNSELNIENLNSIEEAQYKGNIVFNKFNIGKVIGDSNTQNISANVNVDGVGFNLETLRSKVTGEISSLEYNNYEYKNLNVSGQVGKKVFNGKLISKDENFDLVFDGLVDFSKKTNIFNFKADVLFADLHKLNFVSRDKISELKGKINLTGKGTNLDDIEGKLVINNTSYKNQDRHYKFKDTKLTSFFNKDVRTLLISSPDIVDGKITGVFKINDVVNLIENSIGSIYTNYKPNEVSKNQYLDFNFKVYSKIATVFYKDLILSKNTLISGRIETDERGFKLDFSSPEIKFKNHFAQNIALNIDNSNPVYNTFIQVDSLNTGVYNTSDFSLVNVTKRDTLLIKTEFKGGDLNKDKFNLNLFYTINNKNQSILGFRRSKLKFKGNDWFINQNKDTLNKVAFTRDFKFFDLSRIRVNQNNEEILVSGSYTDKNNKTLKVALNEVDLNKITPTIDSLSLKGKVNGNLNLVQKNGTFYPESDLNIKKLYVNRYNLGNLSAYIKGNNSITNYNVDVKLKNDNIESFLANGTIDVNNDNPTIDLNVNFNEFLINPLNPLGEGVINNIRGEVSGFAKVKGNLNKPDITGELLLDRAGLSIPYLNVDYDFDFDSKVTLQKQQFIFNNVALTDSRFFSRGFLNGYIEHNNFSDWKLGLDLSTERLLVLDTEESEDELYYGTAFVSGIAKIHGPTDKLVIDVDGSTAAGTFFNIPLNDSESFGDNSYIHFLSPEEKAARINGEQTGQFEVNGLELNFDLDVNQNASIEIVIDKDSGSTIKGKGEGNLAFFINTNGTFNMWGDFAVFEGTYNFKYKGLVEKRFDVERGGSIVWEGDPLKAQIDLKAVYQGSANPSVLLDNPINQTIPVEVEIHLTGALEQPDPQFDFRFPTVNSTVKSELDYRLSSKDERDNQALIFLATGSFANGVNDVNFSGTIAERLSGIVNSLIGGNNENLNLSFDFELGQDTPDIQTNNRVGFALQTKISDKLLVNGKASVPFGSASQTTITGDVQVDWLLNEDGTLRATVFNKENTIRNFGEEIGFTQGVGLSYSVEFDTFKELLQIIFSGKNKKEKKQKEKKKDPEEEEKLMPDYMQMKEKTP